MEAFPSDKQYHSCRNSQVKITGLVVVQNMKIIGLHCSSKDLHAGQIAIVKHASNLRGCDLYFSRKPCATCLKMIVNAGVNRISYWPADPEISLLNEIGNSTDATLDAKAVERLKSNSRAHVCVLLQPVPCYMQQFVEETSKKSDFLQKICKTDPSFKLDEYFVKYRKNKFREFEQLFLILEPEVHKDILKKIGLENLCEDPFFSNLRQHMNDLIFLLASVNASVPDISDFGFYCRDLQGTENVHEQSISQETARHCMIQARLLSYRTEDHKIGVGAVIWAEGKSGHCDGTGTLYLVGCGYNCYPVGSEYADFPQMDDQQKDREIRKYRYIIHAEQNVFTFRCRDIKEEEKTMFFVTKCPCDECVPLIKAAGIKQIFTGDLDAGKVKDDITYKTFSELQGVRKFIWQNNPFKVSASTHSVSRILTNGCLE
ncbi:cytidine and dCMP deaminase domain-containing protein 1 isoform X2 [Protopterus annectens]|uniref:cytidine and dCMP deaminase domain-containing protein 1 isoform X2 n=1 Tax=Protopterus annectens TaxID=7888 RepID=UPI001CFB0D38|nr:cytidine and dCMP deaminase domain-containing protein 1 isoform X2 [Protopterus annectens]